MSNFNFNKMILGGRITADPEFAVTPSGVPVVRFSMAVNRRANANGEQKADFFSVVAWRGPAEFISKFFRKSSPICVVGSVQTRSWTDDKGVKRYGIDIVADEAYFIDSKADSPAGQQETAAPVTGVPGYNPYTPQNTPTFEQIGADDELPF